MRLSDKRTSRHILDLSLLFLSPYGQDNPPPSSPPTNSSQTAVSQVDRDQSKPVVVDSHVERVSELLSLSPSSLPLSQFSGLLSCNNETSAITGHKATRTCREGER